MQGGGQLPAFVGEMASMTVGYFANEAVISQEPQMTADAGRELFIGSSGAPVGGSKLLAQSSIGNAGYREIGITDGS